MLLEVGADAGDGTLGNADDLGDLPAREATTECLNNDLMDIVRFALRHPKYRPFDDGRG